MFAAAAVVALVVAGSASAQFLTRPAGFGPGGGQAVASNQAPCGGGTSRGVITWVAGVPYAVMWDDANQQQTTSQVTFDLIATNPSTNADQLAFQTAPFYTQAIGGARTEVVVPAGTPDGEYRLQWSWNGFYSCATVDIIAQSVANGFPAQGATVLNGAPAAHSGTVTAGQKDLLIYIPTQPIPNGQPAQQALNDNPPFSRVTITGPTGARAATLAATSWMFNQLDRQTFNAAIPTPLSYDERTDTMETGTGTVGLCRRVNNQQAENNQQEFFLSVFGGPSAAGDAYSVNVQEYNAYVAADNDLSAAPHNGPLYFWTDASSSGDQPRSIYFTSASHDADFRAELSENCEMAPSANNIVYRAQLASGDTYCIDLPQNNDDKYIRIEKSAAPYTVGVEQGSCADYSAAPSAPAAVAGAAAAGIAVAGAM